MKIIAIYFTQSGQQREILDSFVKSFQEAGDEIHFEELKLVDNYPFPWNGYSFFNAFPETFTQQPLALQPMSAKAMGDFDLVIVGYQPWFLTPSRPISTFLQSEAGKKILNNKPVVTVLGCRNMWLGAQEKVKRSLINANANLVGHIALVDRSANLTSLVTILRWMFTGKRTPFSVFPKAGVSDADISKASVYGSAVKNSVANNYVGLQQSLNNEGAIFIKPNLVLMESRGQKAFSVWAKFVASGGPLHSTGRKIRVHIFMYALPTAILILTPLLWVLSNTMLLVRKKHLIKEVEYFQQNSLR